jgi:hypothetical protein
MKNLNIEYHLSARHLEMIGLFDKLTQLQQDECIKKMDEMAKRNESLYIELKGKFGE